MPNDVCNRRLAGARRLTVAPEHPAVSVTADMERWISGIMCS